MRPVDSLHGRTLELQKFETARVQTFQLASKHAIVKVNGCIGLYFILSASERITSKHAEARVHETKRKVTYNWQSLQRMNATW